MAISANNRLPGREEQVVQKENQGISPTTAQYSSIEEKWAQFILDLQEQIRLLQAALHKRQSQLVKVKKELSAAHKTIEHLRRLLLLK